MPPDWPVGPANGKYALLVTPVRRERAPRDLGALDDATVAFVGALGQTVPEDALELWRKSWFGQLDWDEVAGDERLLVFTSMESSRPDVDDGENKALQDRLDRAWLALTLVGPTFPVHGKSWVLTGGLDGAGRPKTSTTFAPLRDLLGPFYARSDAFRRALSHDLPGAWGNDDPWFERWKELDPLVGPFYRHSDAGGFPPLLKHALLSFLHGFAVNLLEVEFRLPNHVRAAECILALPKPRNGVKTGREGFAERGEKLVPSLASHWFAGGTDMGKRLRELYHLRNECVHGMLPFESLRSAGGRGEDDAARFEYLAEELARQSLVAVLRRPDKHHLFKTRKSIEDAWQPGGGMPP